MSSGTFSQRSYPSSYLAVVGRLFGFCLSIYPPFTPFWPHKTLPGRLFQRTTSGAFCKAREPGEALEITEAGSSDAQCNLSSGICKLKLQRGTTNAHQNGCERRQSSSSAHTWLMGTGTLVGPIYISKLFVNCLAVLLKLDMGLSYEPEIPISKVYAQQKWVRMFTKRCVLECS